MPFRVRVVGVGSYLPTKEVSNHELSKSLDTSHEWIMERTGIAKRHLADSDQLTSDLALEASRAALQHAQLLPQDVDLIILATTTPDHTFPATATRLQAKLGNQGAAAFDVGAVCSGFVVAFSTAYAYLSQGMAKTALVVGAETMGRLLDWEDRRTAVLFGDGAGAVVLRAEASTGEAGGMTSPGVLGTRLLSDGSGYDLLRTTGGASSTQTAGVIEMNGREIYKNAVLKLGSVTEEILAAHQLTAEVVDWLVPHQANRRIIEATCKRLGFPDEKVIHTGDQHANTSAASIPLALDVGVKDGRIQPGHLVLCNAFGGGFIWGAALFRIG
ncbi:MAG: beta-ketoacyl-ACP synthase III [Alphaproteobacteria bacterium]